jgi:HlyD family secretion protein
MKLSKPVVLGIGAAAVLVAAVLGWRLVLAHRALPEGLIQVNGRIEGDQVSVASKLAGRIAELKVREGDSVQAGQVLAVMDAAQIQAKVDQAKAVAALASQRAAVDTALAALRRQVPLDQAAADTGVSQAAAVKTKADAARAQAERDAQRLEDLAQRGSVPVQRAEQARLAATAAAADAAAAQEALARAKVMSAQAGLGRTRSAPRRASWRPSPPSRPRPRPRWTRRRACSTT